MDNGFVMSGILAALDERDGPEDLVGDSSDPEDEFIEDYCSNSDEDNSEFDSDNSIYP